jgi:Cu+-exporting ATPase
MITGEPIPSLKKRGDKVVGGTVNRDSVLKIRAERIGKDSLLSQVSYSTTKVGSFRR